MTLAEIAAMLRRGKGGSEQTRQVLEHGIRHFESDPDFTLRGRLEASITRCGHVTGPVSGCPNCEFALNPMRRIRELLDGKP